MLNILEINDFSAPELDIYARRTEAQLLNKDNPELMQEEKLAIILGTEGEGLMGQLRCVITQSRFRCHMTLIH